MKYIIDTDKGSCTPFTETPTTEDYGRKCVQILEPHIGTKEYDGIVATIQRWFYGSVVHASWCATTVSYCLNQCGIPVKQENVLNLIREMEKLPEKYGKMYFRQDFTNLKLKRGDILFWNWNAPKPMSTTSSKHVNFVYDVDPNYKSVKAIGGNQSDFLKVGEYALNEQLYAVWKWR